MFYYKIQDIEDFVDRRPRTLDSGICSCQRTTSMSHRTLMDYPCMVVCNIFRLLYIILCFIVAVV